jgi:hypothetical protein
VIREREGINLPFGRKGQKRRRRGFDIFRERRLVIHPEDYLMENMPGDSEYVLILYLYSDSRVISRHVLASIVSFENVATKAFAAVHQLTLRMHAGFFLNLQSI